VNYPMSIIDYIIFSKIQRDKNVNIWYIRYPISDIWYNI
jgi:hypothetical protein